MPALFFLSEIPMDVLSIQRVFNPILSGIFWKLYPSLVLRTHFVRFVKKLSDKFNLSNNEKQQF